MNWIDKIIEFLVGPDDWWQPRAKCYSGDFEVYGHYFVKISDKCWKCRWCNGAIRPPGEKYSPSEFPIISSLTGAVMIHDCHEECDQINIIVGNE